MTDQPINEPNETPSSGLKDAKLRHAVYRLAHAWLWSGCDIRDDLLGRVIIDLLAEFGPPWVDRPTWARWYCEAVAVVILEQGLAQNSE